MCNLLQLKNASDGSCGTNPVPEPKAYRAIATVDEEDEEEEEEDQQ